MKLCIDCNRELSANTYTRCLKCSLKRRVGKKAHHYKHGKYIQKHSHCIDCSKKLCHNGTAKRCFSCAQLERFKIPQNHGAWKGGLSRFPYSYKFNNKLKESIRKRDIYRCQLCNISQNNLTKKLFIHHINYDKTNSRQENLISLCPKCHSATNWNRDYWYAYFTYIIQNK